MQDQPLVSVITPVYNCEKFLAAAIESVFAQTYHPIEIIIVDDGSTDQSGVIARSYSPIKYIYQENHGVSAARNIGVDAATGEFIAFLDADDLWLPKKLQIQIDCMLNNPTIDIIGAKAEWFLEQDTQLPDWFDHERDMLKDNSFLQTTLLTRKVSFDRVGNFSTAYEPSEDLDWLWRAKDIHLKIEVLPEILARRRLHGLNLSWQMRAGHKLRILKIIKNLIARQQNRID